MRKIFFITAIVVVLFGANCDNKLFSYANSMNINEHLNIKSFLNLLVTQKCGINIVYDDDIAKKIVNEKMPFLRIKNSTLREILDLILTKKGLFYTLDNNTLEISYFKTKTYKINFISAVRMGESTLDATDNKVQNTYRFDFWDKIKNKLIDLLTNNYYIDPNFDLLSNYMKNLNAIKQINNQNNYDETINPKIVNDSSVNMNIENKSDHSSTYQVPIFMPVIDKDSGMIIVTGTMKQLNEVDKYINNLINSLTKEVLLDVHIYSVELSSSHKTGIDWSQLSLSLGKVYDSGANKYVDNPASVPLRAVNIFGKESIFNATTFNVSAFLNFLAQNGNVNSISNPKIVTLNNQQSIISVGDTIYYKYASKVVTDQNGNPSTQYTVDSKFVGIVLDITPQISDDGTIVLSISPKLSKFRDYSQLTQNDRGMPPDTTDDTMQSVVKLKNNQTLVLGGLITDDKQLQVNGVPVLKEIPLIRYFFSSREKITSKKELVFVITPHIITFKKKKTLRDLGFGQIR